MRHVQRFPKEESPLKGKEHSFYYHEHDQHPVAVVDRGTNSTYLEVKSGMDAGFKIKTNAKQTPSISLYEPKSKNTVEVASRKTTKEEQDGGIYEIIPLNPPKLHKGTRYSVTSGNVTALFEPLKSGWYSLATSNSQNEHLELHVDGDYHLDLSRIVVPEEPKLLTMSMIPDGISAAHNMGKEAHEQFLEALNIAKIYNEKLIGEEFDERDVQQAQYWTRECERNIKTFFVSANCELKRANAHQMCDEIPKKETLNAYVGENMALIGSFTSAIKRAGSKIKRGFKKLTGKKNKKKSNKNKDPKENSDEENKESKENEKSEEEV